jgi:hypothetical protein
MRTLGECSVVVVTDVVHNIFVNVEENILRILLLVTLANVLGMFQVCWDYIHCMSQTHQA